MRADSCRRCKGEIEDKTQKASQPVIRISLDTQLQSLVRLRDVLTLLLDGLRRADARVEGDVDRGATRLGDGHRLGGGLLLGLANEDDIGQVLGRSDAAGRVLGLHAVLV